MVENALLRQQLIIVQRETKRPKLTWRDRALIAFGLHHTYFWTAAQSDGHSQAQHPIVH